MARRWLALIWLAFSLAVIACQGEEAEEEVGLTPTSTPALLPTPVETPIITGNQLEFPARGYAARFPAGWKARPEFYRGPAFVTDAFFSPEEEEGVQPNIAVTCDSIAEEVTLESYVQQKVDLATEIAGEEPEARPTQVDGEEAFIIEYSAKDESPPLDVTQAMFVNERCGWTIAMTVPLGRRAAFQGLLDDFVDSFRLLP